MIETISRLDGEEEATPVETPAEEATPEVAPEEGAG